MIARFSLVLVWLLSGSICVAGPVEDLETYMQKLETQLQRKRLLAEAIKADRRDISYENVSGIGFRWFVPDYWALAEPTYSLLHGLEHQELAVQAPTDENVYEAVSQSIDLVEVGNWQGAKAMLRPYLGSGKKRTGTKIS
jgi:hypothetical protein